MKNFFFCCFLFLSFFAFSQSNWDTTKYLKYKDRLIVSGYYSYRNFDYSITRNNPTVLDTMAKALHYKAAANNVIGLEFDYDKVSFAFGIKSSDANDSTKGKTSFKNFAFSFGGNKWIIEASYRNYKGFYDQNTATYDTTMKTTHNYFQIPSMQVKQAKVKFMYFTNNKKFAYKAGYSYSCRQIKSAFTWVLGGNFYYNGLTTDSSLLPIQVRKSYSIDAYLKGVKVYGASAGAGASLNLVIWKTLFANFTFVLYGEPQWRTYTRLNGPNTQLCYLSASGDARLALGFNAKNFFFMFNSYNDFVYLNTGNSLITSKFISGSVSIGYRFKVKTPGFYKK
ncbi:MAG: DUF4421 family protein, partial [Bacteroidia bacterium]|nr:DUF4421 family protein [Bacteroidia bacterium]